VESSSSLIFLAFRNPSEPIKLLGTTPGDTLTTQTTRLLSTSPTTTGFSLKLNREHLWKKLPRSFKPTPIPDIRKKWKLELYIQDKEREWHILGGEERQR
jgi:hypothetical protein